MENKTISKEKSEWIDIIMVTIILFTNLVITSSKYIRYVYIVAVITSIYTIFLILKRFGSIKKLFSTYCFLWIIAFAIEMFLYGYFGENKEAYSLAFHILNVLWIIILLIILYNNSSRVIEIATKSSSIVIVMMSIYILATSNIGLMSVFSGNINGIIGQTAVGNQNTTAISYIFLLIPIIYKIGLNKEKKYIPVALLGIIFMLLTGSKKGIISLILMIMIIYINKATNKNKLLMDTLKFGLLITIIVMLCYYIPVLHSFIWERLESMITSLNNFNPGDESSTNLRMNFIITAFTKAWDEPILGHGWGAFAQKYGYSSLYKTNLYTHNNYAEVLFSFGLFGMFLYYWFPVRTIIKTAKQEKKDIKTLCWLYIIILLFIDFGTVSCYSSILVFLGFSIVSLLLKTHQKM